MSWSYLQKKQTNKTNENTWNYLLVTYIFPTYTGKSLDQCHYQTKYPSEIIKVTLLFLPKHQPIVRAEVKLAECVSEGSDLEWQKPTRDRSLEKQMPASRRQNPQSHNSPHCSVCSWRESPIRCTGNFFPHEGSKALERVLRQAVGFLPLEILHTQLIKAL